MAFIPVSRAARLTMESEQDGQILANVFWFQQEPSAGYDASSLADLATKFDAAWTAHIADFQTSDVLWSRIVARAMDSASSPAIEQFMTGAGGHTGDNLPTNVTFAIKWVTGLAGRSFRGRTYHIGLRGDFVQDSRVLTTPAADMVQAYKDLLDELAAGGHIMGVVSLESGGNPRIAGVFTPILTSALADTNVDSQRRRLPGRGS